MSVQPLFSGILACLLGCIQVTAAPAWEWQKAQARVTEKGDLEWSPESYEYRRGAEVRYIDYENGDDARDGTTPEAAWRHHPWDADASGRAAESGGARTYVFKSGVTYRGRLIARESGLDGNPIRLTVDPAWGQGEARFYGSAEIRGGWKRATVDTAPGIPEPEKVWYQDTDLEQVPRALWQTDATGEVQRIALARSPNWSFSNPDDFKSEWWEWKTVGTGSPPGSSVVMNKVADPDNLSALDITGATVWSEWIPVMGTPHGAKVEAHDLETGTVYFTGFFEDTNRMEPENRYFIEDLPQFLDAPGEYYFADSGPHRGRLYVRLHADADPREVTVEAGQHLTQIDLRGHSHIHIEGLVFRFTNMYDPTVRPRIDPDVHSASVRSYGNGVDIRIAHCRFEHVSQAAFLKAYGDGDRMDEIDFSDNLVRHTDHGALHIENGSYFWRQLPGIGELGRVVVMRNKMEDIGFRPERKYHGHALVVLFAEQLHVAGNILERTGGAGIYVFGGKGSNQLHAQPFSRMLVHHNKVVDSMLNSNDWGGIESWQGGPSYVYNNISGNPGGYWHWKHKQTLRSNERDHTSARFGFAYYLDGTYKNYVFNNIAWGKSSDLNSPLLNSAAFQEIHGFQNAYFHNTAFRFAAGTRRQAPAAGRNLYLANIWMDISETVFWHAFPRNARADDNAEHVGRRVEDFEYETLGYKNNIFEASPQYFGTFEASGVRHDSLESFSDALKEREVLQAQTGWAADVHPVRDAEAHDFRLHADSAAIDRGVKVFVPWALSGVVGEWHFLHNRKDPARIRDEHWNMTEYFTNRAEYHHVPKFDLQVIHAADEAFVSGALEDWTEGALHLDGQRYARLAHEDVARDVPFKLNGKDYVWPGSRVLSVDMHENSFLIEVVFRTEQGHTGGLLAGKGGEGESGYRLRVNDDGLAELELIYQGNVICSRSSGTVVNDGAWHHLLVEVDRDRIQPENQPINIYLNGVADNGDWRGIMPTKYIQFSNSSDFMVGGGPQQNHLHGDIDFLRVARSTLRDAHTSIEELHTWQFDGPHLKDFFGNPPEGLRRDAGAFELGL